MITNRATVIERGSKKTWVVLVATVTLLAGSASAQVACVEATPACKESMAVETFNFWYYRSFSLQTPNLDITRAVIVIHGMQRDAGVYFKSVVDALHNELDPTLLVIAPHFKGFVSTSMDCRDPLEARELHWSCTGPPTSTHRWDDGGEVHNTGGAGIYSFSMIDRLLDILNDPSLFPNLQKITITGHSDGGQFTQRYLAGNRQDGRILPLVKYVIANPGSYMYLDNRRLLKGETCFEDGTCSAPFTEDWDPNPDPEMNCLATYNNYKYGLASRTFGYMNSDQDEFSDPDVRDRYLSRNVAYLVGELDQSGASPLDRSCSANAQGSHTLEDDPEFIGGRRERGTIFWNYIQKLGATHTLTIVPNCGHDPVCMYCAEETVQAILF